MGLRIVLLASALMFAVGGAPAAETLAPSLHERIDRALTAGRADEASVLIATESASPSIDLDLDKAEYALATGDLKAATDGFAALTGVPAVAPRAYQGLGLARLRAGDAGAAITALDAALALDPNLVRSLIARGVAADDAKDWGRAEGFYERAVYIEPNSAVALTNRGYSRLCRGRFADAIVDLRRAVALDPGLKAARTDLQLALAASGDYKAAFAGATKATLAHDLNTIGFAAMTRGEYALAETYFARAMEVNPEFDRVAWANLVYVKQLTHAAAATSTP